MRNGLHRRSGVQLDRARKAAEFAGIALKVRNNADTTVGRVSISTMHLAKGLEFKCVAVMACDDNVLTFPFIGLTVILKRLDDFRFKHRFMSRAAAVKWLLEFALDQKPVPKGE